MIALYITIRGSGAMWVINLGSFCHFDWQGEILKRHQIYREARNDKHHPHFRTTRLGLTGR
jgi:hypothetical protein